MFDWPYFQPQVLCHLDSDGDVPGGHGADDDEREEDVARLVLHLAEELVVLVAVGVDGADEAATVHDVPDQAGVGRPGQVLQVQSLRKEVKIV